MEQSDSQRDESLNQSNSFEPKSQPIKVSRPRHGQDRTPKENVQDKNVREKRQHVNVINRNQVYSPKTPRKRDRSQENLTEQEAHVQVDPIDKQQHSSKTKRKLLTDRKHVDIARVCPVTPPMSPNTRQHQQRIKEDYITARGHVQVEGTNGAASFDDARAASSYKHVGVVPLSQTRQNSDKNSGERVLIELIDEDDLFQPMGNRMVESDNEEVEDDNYSVVYVNEDDVQVLDCVAPPQHTDIQLVSRHQSKAKIHQHRQRNIEKAEYLMAQGHVNIVRPKKKQKKIIPLVDDTEYRLASHRRINVLVLEPESDASPPMKQRTIEASPRVHRTVQDELDVKSTSLNTTNVDVQLTSVSYLSFCLFPENTRVIYSPTRNDETL